ncbi:polysaccharide biosynthesis tyrosine autokinase [Staphylococcus simulans]|uniref:polysaccharide biosynthesis tyrosine autokinase n=2 Tax=Staphylococcus simulans TaxID=1286 RepID=UPI000D1E0D3E|nr:polysaccharide biosynthesis tyrosine autokinase [Staphylococcus simulans]PTJ95606.1 capsular biosynthesis protein [Staphylococcus simulans]
MAKKDETVQNPIITFSDPKSVISEKFRGIRTNIMFSTADNDIKSIVFTSEKPSAGKSLVSANIAVTYAQAGFNTLLIDGDMRKPTQHYLFNASNIDGFSNLIINQSYLSKAIEKTEVENLDLLTSGPIPPNPSELIGSSQCQSILEELYEIYDIIIIDTPPVNTVTDAQLFAEISGYVAMVIDVKKNDRNAVKKAKELVEKAGAKVLGVILNETTPDKSSGYYAYYGEDKK